MKRPSPVLWLLFPVLLCYRPGPGAFVGRWATPGRLRGARAAARARPRRDVEVRFSHAHLYVDALGPLEGYKRLEAKLNAFAEGLPDGSGPDIAAGRRAWLSLAEGDPAIPARDPAEWSPARQDIVEQLLVGLGWRVTGSCRGHGTESLVVTSPDPEGVKLVVTARSPPAEEPEAGQVRLGHFEMDQLDRFWEHRAGREGIAVLGFLVPAGGVERVHARYKELHPKLLLPNSLRSYGSVKVLEVCAYYLGEKQVSEADRGTLLRFVEMEETGSEAFVLPGIEKVPASFNRMSSPAFCDHWVSNVVSRTGFLDTLEDTLGFSPKVDFNAGVVAAGEARIESTVTGNSPGHAAAGRDEALRDQRQVYLPINNALSEVGHVHLYLEEIGQGVQHIASRVADLPDVVQRANDLRAMTGAGLSFLSIPRSYYGMLSAGRLARDAGIEAALAEQCVASLVAAGIADRGGVVDLDATREQVASALPPSAPPSVVGHVLRARYGNLYSLAGDRIDEETYLRIVRNKILLDVQGDDLLLQIFTCNVLQRAPGEEAPFLELIQRVCSERRDAGTGLQRGVRPGCGGFGIRNFLTLFLSIEISKAAKLREDAEAAGDHEGALYHGRMVGLFNEQLDESNPILTQISDAMTAEGEALERGDASEAARLEAEKDLGQEALQHISTKYRKLMAGLRAEYDNEGN